MLDFVKDIKAGQTIQISFGRQFIMWYDFEDLIYYADENEVDFNDQLYASLIDNMSIQYYLANYL